MAAAAGQGGFDHEDMHMSRTSVRLTPEAWKAASAILAQALDEIEALGAEGAAHPESEPDGEERHAIAVMMLFEAASPRSFDSGSEAPGAHDGFEDMATPAQRAK